MAQADDLQPKIQATLEDHLTTRDGGGFITGWHLVAEYIDADGEESWLYATAEEQRAMTTIGLIEWARGVARYEQQRYLNSIAEE